MTLRPGDNITPVTKGRGKIRFFSPAGLVRVPDPRSEAFWCNQFGLTQPNVSVVRRLYRMLGMEILTRRADCLILTTARQPLFSSDCHLTPGINVVARMREIPTVSSSQGWRWNFERMPLWGFDPLNTPVAI